VIRDRTPLILASGSPRRSGILHALGIDHDVHPAEVDESVLPGEGPEDHAERLARAKAAAVAELNPGRWVLAGDTVVVVDGAILGKPRDEEHAVEMLMKLQGRTHRVVSSLALARPPQPSPAGTRAPSGEEPGGEESRMVDPGPASGRSRILSGVQSTRVRFRPFERPVAEAYAATGEPMDKAGAYGIQGRGGVLVEGVEGDYSGVVGLPVPLLVRLLEEAGRPYRFG
jgi:septum formation protein